MRRFLAGIALAALANAAIVARAAAQDGTTVIQTSKLIDGRGAAMSNVDITVVNGLITHIGPAGPIPKGARVVDLRGKTVLPGLIDVHSHLTWYFNRQGRYHQGGRNANDNDTPIESILAAAANAYATLMAGFTTVQSPGSPEDADLRDWITTQGLPGPRILTSLTPLQGGSPDTLRALVRRRKAAGADLIKIFASASIRDGGKQSMTDEQLAAACGEAAAQGMRTIVHAHSAESVRATVNAGCTQVEHGIFVTQAELDLMAQKNVVFDPQCSLVFHNYLDNRAKYDGIGNYNAEGFAAMERAIPLAAQDIRMALATKGLKIAYGTDAVAGAHGRNGEDLICRVKDAGEPPMHAIMSATSVNAASLKLGDKIGAIAPGMEADIIAMDGDPLTDITAVRRVSFVMKGGKIFRNEGKN